MRTLRFVLPFLALAVAGCTGRVAAKPGVGVGVEHRADGGRLGLDLGTYDVGGSAVEPITGNCPGGVCNVPGGEPTVPVPVSQVKAAQDALASRGDLGPAGAVVAVAIVVVLAIFGYVALASRKVKS